MSVIRSLRRFDDAVARGEAAVAAVVLLLMILVAVGQALLRTLTAFEVGFANQALEHFTWADPFLQKGTLWLAFLGASLATHDDKHIAIDVLHRVVPPRVREAMRGFVGIIAGVISLSLAYVFRLSIMNYAGSLPLDRSVVDVRGRSVHVCTVTASKAAEVGLDRPDLFCGLRSALDGLGLHISTPTNALELIVPLMCVVIGVRFFVKGIAAFIETAKPGILGAKDAPGVETGKEG
jgi:TRAP-type C4-dicarboxylate transport system permease small subunit